MSSASPPAGTSPEVARGPWGRRTWVFVLVAVIVAAAAFGASYYFLTLTAPLNRPPVAMIQSSVTHPVTYQTVAFNASASSDPDGDALTYAWKLPNGFASGSMGLNYTFASTGVFEFELTVTDSHGARGTAWLNATVSPAPLIVGTNIPYPPFEDYNGTTYVGFDIDLVDALAGHLGYAPSWVEFADFSVLLTTVSHGGVDMAASAITSSGAVGAARNTTMYFSNPYYAVSFGVLVQSASNLSCSGSMCTPQELANRTIGVQAGTSEEMWVQDNLVATNLTPSSKVMTYTTVNTEIAALEAGSLDMVIVQAYAAQTIAAGSGGALRVPGVINTGELYSFAFPRTPAGLVLKTRNDAALSWAMQTGVYQNLYAEWFAM